MPSMAEGSRWNQGRWVSSEWACLQWRRQHLGARAAQNYMKLFVAHKMTHAK